VDWAGVAMTEAEHVRITVDKELSVSGLLRAPRDARALYVLAHGAGAGMRHPFLAAVAKGLAERGMATLRYQFPYMERGSKRPDKPEIAHATVRAAMTEARRRLPRLLLFAGGKSFGGRMTSQAQALAPIPGVRGLIFLGFPFHPAGRPSQDRAQHLFEVAIPMLFLQGTGDSLAELPQLEPICERLGKRTELKLVEDADHSFHVPAKSGRKDADVLNEILDATASWIDRVAAFHPS
jgi:predicted alpha/beta-hydrolase family hydrolase